MSKDIEKLRMVNLGMLDTFELERFQSKIKQELNYRKDNPDELVSLYHFDDGCEGFYCPIDKFEKVEPLALFQLMCEALLNNSSFSIKVVEMPKTDAKKVLDRYGWFENDENEDL